MFQIAINFIDRLFFSVDFIFDSSITDNQLRLTGCNLVQRNYFCFREIANGFAALRIEFMPKFTKVYNDTFVVSFTRNFNLKNPFSAHSLAFGR